MVKVFGKEILLTVKPFLYTHALLKTPTSVCPEMWIFEVCAYLFEIR